MVIVILHRRHIFSIKYYLCLYKDILDFLKSIYDKYLSIKLWHNLSFLKNNSLYKKLCRLFAIMLL